MVTDPLYALYYDEKFRAFISGLSTTDTLPRFGIRLPVLEKISREIDWKDLEIKWHEDVILTGLAIGNSSLTPIEKVEELKKLLPYLSTWDQTDSIASRFKVRKKNKEVFYAFFTSLLSSSLVFPRRLGIVWLMGNRREFDEDQILSLIINADIEDEYFISMAVAWSFASFVADDYSFMERFGELAPETRKKAERKIRESRRTGKH